MGRSIARHSPEECMWGVAQPGISQGRSTSGGVCSTTVNLYILCRYRRCILCSTAQLKAALNKKKLAKKQYG